MNIKKENITIRLVENKQSDIDNLYTWWNDGSVMAHAGFPNGLGITKEEIMKQVDECISKKTNSNRHIIEINDIPVGEMNYREIINNNEKNAEIGIKICEVTMQNKGFGKKILTMFIDNLFKQGYEKIILDTNLNNKRAQHVYEELGFKKIRININNWKDQLGALQSSVDYELTEKDFNKFL